MDLFFIVLLIIASIVGLTFIVERGLALRWNKVIPSEVEAAVEACRNPGDLPMLRHLPSDDVIQVKVSWLIR